MLTPLGYFDLIDAMAEPNCPVCRLLKRDASKLLTTLLYESVTQPETHAIFRQSFGLCNVHGWQMAEQGNVMSIAVLYSAVVDETLKQTKNPANVSQRLRGMFNRTPQSDLSNAVTPDGDCPVCKRLDENQERYISVFVDKLTDERMMIAFESSDGLCLSHFRQIVALNSTEVFVEMQRKKWQSVYDDMQEFIRKYDPTKADSAIGAEGDSWLRAIRQMVGEKGTHPQVTTGKKFGR